MLLLTPFTCSGHRMVPQPRNPPQANPQFHGGQVKKGVLSIESRGPVLGPASPSLSSLGSLVATTGQEPRGGDAGLWGAGPTSSLHGDTEARRGLRGSQPGALGLPTSQLLCHFGGHTPQKPPAGSLFGTTYQRNKPRPFLAQNIPRLKRRSFRWHHTLVLNQEPVPK